MCVRACVYLGDHTTLRSDGKVHKRHQKWIAVRCSALQCIAVCRSMLQCVAVCCSVLQCVAVCRRNAIVWRPCKFAWRWQNAAVCCSVLQCVAEMPYLSKP